LYKIAVAKDLGAHMHLFEIEAPAIANKAQAGQFVILRLDEKGERIPLTISGWNREKGTVTIVFREVGNTTDRLATLKAGDSILDFV